MSDENQVPEQSSLFISSQEPTEPTPINTAYSEPSVMPLDAPEAPGNDFSVKSNDIIEKFLHISDATATRYLSQLEKEGKIKQSGKTGHAVS